jgi:hypothetical protein
VSATPPTPDEVRIAERYLSVLADVSRCADAVRNGDWQQLAGTADDLCRRAALLAEAAGKIEHGETSHHGCARLMSWLGARVLRARPAAGRRGVECDGSRPVDR